MLKNKRGWIRILEAGIAIMLILGFMLYIRGQNEKVSLSDSMYKVEHQILSEAIANESVRNEILQKNIAPTGLVGSFLTSRLQSYNLNYNFTICEITESCIAQTPKDKEVYPDNIVVSSDPNSLHATSKKLALFVWIE